MTFYFPLNLGVESQPSSKNDPNSRSEKLPLYDAWREGIESNTRSLKPRPERTVIDSIIQKNRSHTTVITGEPGSGKTQLMQQWFYHCLRNVEKYGIATPLPVLVRLRKFNGDNAIDLENSIDQGLRELLWEKGLSESALPDVTVRNATHLYRRNHVHYYPFMWLLDGLDEIDSSFLRNESFYQSLINLPGIKIITCRTATYQTLRATEQGYLPKPLSLLSLSPAEQLEFLEILHNHSDSPNNLTEPKKLHREICSHSQLKPLAGNPLMLEIMGTLVDLPLPKTRYQLYEKFVNRLWEKLDNPETLEVERDQILIKCAEQAWIHSIHFSLTTVQSLIKNYDSSINIRKTLDEMRRSGIIRFLENSQCEFIHLTFHEYFLAQSMIQTFENKPLDSLILEYWTEPRLEETLALAISYELHLGNETTVLRSIELLIMEGNKLWNTGRHYLSNIGRSPLRTALHLIQRSGCDLNQNLLIFNLLRSAIRPKQRTLAVALDPRTPPDLLAALAHDIDDYVIRAVAGNISTPSPTLALLSNSNNVIVRTIIASNISTSPDTLTALASDEEISVRSHVAGNASTPPMTLAMLCDDEESQVRRSVIGTFSTSQHTLDMVASDEHTSIRQNLAGNTSTHQETLARLACDDESRVRTSVAGNTSTPQDTLDKLAGDEDKQVRSRVASNVYTPPATLNRLASDKESRVRKSVAGNPSTPSDTLTWLASDQDGWVRRSVAGNVQTLLESLRPLNPLLAVYIQVKRLFFLPISRLFFALTDQGQ